MSRRLDRSDIHECRASSEDDAGDYELAWRLVHAVEAI
jgi:hypothetical protein